MCKWHQKAAAKEKAHKTVVAKTQRQRQKVVWTDRTSNKNCDPERLANGMNGCKWRFNQSKTIVLIAYWNKSTLYSNAFLLSFYSAHNWLIDSYFDFNMHFRWLHFYDKKLLENIKVSSHESLDSLCLLLYTHTPPHSCHSNEQSPEDPSDSSKQAKHSTDFNAALTSLKSFFSGVLKNKIKVKGAGTAGGKQS